MTEITRRRARLGACILLSASAFTGFGCKEKGPRFEIITLEGKVEKLETNPDGTGVITVGYFSEKHGQEMVGAGIVDRNTEIIINGAVARLEDVRVGEHVRGEVRIEKGDNSDSKIQTALKIYVDRAEPPAGDE